MAEKWFDNVPDDAFPDKTDKLYMEEALAMIKAGLSEGLDFDRASAAVAIADGAQTDRVTMCCDVAEGTFSAYDQLSRNLNLSFERKKAREMLEDVENRRLLSIMTTSEGTEH
jgi:hypothetical protein